MPTKKGYNKKKRFRRNRRKFKKKFKRRSRPAGDSYTRSFKYSTINTGEGLRINGVLDASSPTFSYYFFTHSLGDVGMADATIFLKYFQQYRISKVYVKVECLTNEPIPTFDVGVNTTGIGNTQSFMQNSCSLLLMPWRDGYKQPIMSGATWDKCRQAKGARLFTNVLEQLQKGYTHKYTPNTLDIGFEIAGSVTDFYTYTPQYKRWLSNNEGSTQHYGVILAMKQQSRQAILLKITQTVTVEYRYKIVDPLISIEQSDVARQSIEEGEGTHEDHVIIRQDAQNVMRCVPISLQRIEDEEGEGGLNQDAIDQS